jgi:Glycosyltransferase family 87
MSGVAKTGLPYPGALRWLAILSLAIIATGALTNSRYPYLMDFLSYWAAAVQALEGHAAGAYDVMQHHAVQERAIAFDTRMPFAYPPAYLLVILPFGLMPYWASAATWIAATLAGYGAAVRRLMPGFGHAALAFPPVAVCGIIAQNGMLTASLFIAGLASMTARPFVAGLLFGCLSIKPQLGLLLPLAFIAGREWRTFAGASVAVVGLAAASLVAFGPGPWQAFAAQMTLAGDIAANGLAGWHKLASPYAAMRLAGLSANIAWSVHALIAAVAAIAVWQVWRHQQDSLARGAILAPATLLVSPYLYVYDQIILILPLYWLARQGFDRRAVLLLLLLPLIGISQYWAANPAFNAAPALPLLLLAIVWRTQGSAASPDPLHSSGAFAPAVNA